MPRIIWTWTAFTGVLRVGCTAPKKPGNSPPRPMLNTDRVAAVAPALALARQLLRMAIRTAKPPMTGRTPSAIPPHGSPLLNPRNSLAIRSGPK